MSDTPDAHEDLGSRLESGDEQALAELFSLHRERLWRTVNFRLDRRLYGRIDPDDVLQEAYLAAAQRIEHYDAETYTSPFLWLRAIVNQTLIDVHRRHVGAQMRDAGREVRIHNPAYTQTTATSLAIQLAGSKTSPSKAAVRAETLSQIEQAIGGMDPIDQEILALRHFEELSNSEVAAALGIQQKAASIRYVRAVRRLKEILAEIPGFLDESQNG